MHLTDRQPPRLKQMECGMFFASGPSCAWALIQCPWPKWRNGRRRGFKIPRLHGRESSSLSLGTTSSFNLLFVFRDQMVALLCCRSFCCRSLETRDYAALRILGYKNETATIWRGFLQRLKTERSKKTRQGEWETITALRFNCSSQVFNFMAKGEAGHMPQTLF